MTAKSPCFFLTTYLLCLISAGAYGVCDFDTDDADSPNFVDKIIDCDKQNGAVSKAANADRKDRRATKLYGDGTQDLSSGIFERPVVAAGSMNHSANKAFAARQGYSLRPDAKFEQSVTLAIQRLHIEMAHHCARGWSIDAEWSEPNPDREGDYFLHYRFICGG